MVSCYHVSAPLCPSHEKKKTCIRILISPCFYWLFPVINHALLFYFPPHVEQLSSWFRHHSSSILVLSPGLHPHPPGPQLPSFRNSESSLFPESLLGLRHAFKTLPGLRCLSMFSASRSLQDTHRPAHLRLPTPCHYEDPSWPHPDMLLGLPLTSFAPNQVWF